MARVVVECPSCNTRLETSSENVGRDGQCPACEEIFSIPAASGIGPAAGGRAARKGSAEAEYQDFSVLFSAVGVGFCLLLLVLSTFLHWVTHRDAAGPFVELQQAQIRILSLGCVAFLGVSLATRRSLLPAVLAGGAWGTAATVWIVALERLLESLQTGPASGAAYQGSQPWMFLAVFAGALTVAATVYAYYKYQSTLGVSAAGLYFLVAEVIAVAAAVCVVAVHIRPRVDVLRASAAAVAVERPAAAPPPAQPAAARPADTPAPAATAPTTPQPAPVEPPTGHAIWIEGEDAVERNVNSDQWYNGVNKSLLSGGNWLCHYISATNSPGTATYVFTAPEVGRYTLWVRCNPEEAAYSYRFDDGYWVPLKLDSVRYRTNLVAAEDFRFIGWVSAGEFPLTSGAHRLAIRFHGRTANSGGVDCMALVDFPWSPRTVQKPAGL